MSAGLPVGGTTGLSHDDSAAIDCAAEWLVSTPYHQRPRPLVWHLRETFGLTVSQACQAIAEAARLEQGGANAKP
ncbi:MAG: hypothetical protein H0T56_03390 [Pseudaminobacter sp.]|nr:hypothetical protein [Pseudaminobacter sp.]